MQNIMWNSHYMYENHTKTYCATQAKTLSKLKLGLGKSYKGHPLYSLSLSPLSLSSLYSTLKLAVYSAPAQLTSKMQSKHNKSK